jgi:hypothetical protein
MRRAWYFVALVPLLVGAAFGALAFMRLVDTIQAMPRMVAPGEKSFALPAGEHVIFVETASTVDGVAYANDRGRVTCGVKASDGSTIALAHHEGKLKYSLGGHSGGAVFNFTMPSEGNALVGCSVDDGKVVIAVGQSFGFMIVVAVVPLVLGAIASVVAFVIVYRRRKRYLELVGKA